VVCPAEGVALAAAGGAENVLGFGCRPEEGWRLVGQEQRSRRRLVCGEGRVCCGNGRGDAQIPNLESVAVTLKRRNKSARHLVLFCDFLGPVFIQRESASTSAVLLLALRTLAR
jgi:hypothetical protein